MSSNSSIRNISNVISEMIAHQIAQQKSSQVMLWFDLPSDGPVLRSSVPK